MAFQKCLMGVHVRYNHTMLCCTILQGLRCCPVTHWDKDCTGAQTLPASCTGLPPWHNNLHQVWRCGPIARHAVSTAVLLPRVSKFYVDFHIHPGCNTKQDCFTKSIRKLYEWQVNALGVCYHVAQ